MPRVRPRPAGKDFGCRVRHIVALSVAEQARVEAKLRALLRDLPVLRRHDTMTMEHDTTIHAARRLD